MKVGIFETTHFEGAYPIIKLFDDGKTEITVFSYPQAYHQFKYLFGENLNNYHWIIKEKESKIRFIFRIYTETKKEKLTCCT